MRICLISREYPPDTGWGGIGAYTFQHAHALKELGHDVEVISLAAKDQTLESSSTQSQDSLVPVHRAVWSNLLQELSTVWISLPYSHYVLKSSLALWRKFLEVHTANPFDVVEAPEHLAEALFPSLSRCSPLVVRLHTPHSKFIAERYHNLAPDFDQNLVAILERSAMLQADLLSSPSEDLANYVAGDCGCKRDEICIVRNPVDTQKFTPEGTKAIAENGQLTVFFAGRLEERKGIAHLIAAIPKVIAQNKNVRFLVVGADTNTAPGKTSVLKALKADLEQSGCSQYVQFISHVPLAEMPAHYRSADICVVPSLYENAPYTVLEAMASGKPVIGSAAGGTPEYVVNGKTGIVVPPANPEAIATALLELINDPAKRLLYGKTARETALNSFDRLIIAKQALGTYEFAKARHEHGKQFALYRKSEEESIKDFVNLIHSYHKNLCQLIYVHSLRFRLRTWLQQLTKRPRLAVGQFCLWAAKKAYAQNSTPSWLEKLEHDIAAKLTIVDTNTEEALLRSVLKTTKQTRSNSEQKPEAAAV